MLRFILKSAATAALALLCGCSSLVKKPEVEIKQVRLKSLSKKEIQLVFFMDVKNPNAFDLNLDAIQYKAQLNERAVADNRITEKFRLKGNAVTAVELPASFQYKEVFASLMDLLRDHRAQYKVEGTVRAEGLVSLPFKGEGQLELPVPASLGF